MMSNKKPVAIRAIKDGFNQDGTKVCELGEEYSISRIEKSGDSELMICAHTLVEPNHWWCTNDPDFKSHFEILYEDKEEPNINLQVDRVELGLLFKLINGNKITPAEKRELYDLRSHVEKLLQAKR